MTECRPILRSKDQNQKRAPFATTARERKESAKRYDLHEQVGFQLRVANQIAVELFSEVLESDFGRGAVTTTQFAVLSTVWERPGITQSELASYVSMDMPTLNELLKRLIRRGLLLAEVSVTDKRRRAIFLSPEGKRLAERLRSSGSAVSERILAPLSASDRVALGRILDTFIASHRAGAK